MLRSVAAYLFAAALLLLSPSAFRQALSELRQTEPGSLLFGVLQLVIGTSAVMAAAGLVKRARWAAGAVAIWGVATGALLALQPVFTPMDSGTRWSIWLAATTLGVAAAGVSWFARGLARGDAASRAGEERASEVLSGPVLLADARHPAQPMIARAPNPPDAHGSHGTPWQDERPPASGAPLHE